MSEFNIKISKAKSAVSALKGEAGSIAAVYNTVDNVSHNLGFRIMSSARIEQRLKETLEDISREKMGLNSMSSALDSIITEYRQTETKVADNGAGRKSVGFGAYVMSKLGPAAWLWPVGTLIAPDASAVSALQLFKNWWTDDNISHWGLEANGWDTNYEGFNGSVDFSKFKNSDGDHIFGIGKDLEDFNDKHKYSFLKDKEGQVKGGSGKFIYEKGKGWRSVQTKSDKEEFDELKNRSIYDGVDVTIAKAGVSKEDSLWHKEGELGDENGSHLSGKIRVGNFDREANAYIGPLSAGVSAGMSISALQLSGEMQGGDDMLGIYAKGEVDVLKAGLKGDASIGLYDKDGNFSPNGHIGAEAQALLAEASAQVGAKFLGTDVGLKGSVNVGIGAHADVGLKDGKITFDVGASLGVGVGVKLEIDVSGTVDAVCDAAQSVLDKVGSVTEGLSNIGKGLSDLFHW